MFPKKFGVVLSSYTVYYYTAKPININRHNSKVNPKKKSDIYLFSINCLNFD